MELLSVIRRWAFRDRLSIREISRRTGLSRNTIRKYLRSDVVEPAFKGPARSSKLDAFADKLSAWLKAEGSRPRKQKRTVKQLHADLVALGFDGSYGRVAAFARTWKTEETVQDVGGLSAISLSGPIGWSIGKRDDQGRDDLPALFSPHILDGL